MALQVIINIFIGILWMFFMDNWGVLSFSAGYLVGLLVLLILRRFLPSKFYLVTLIAAVRLTLIFIGELFVASIVIIRIIISPKLKIKPGIFSLETSLRGDVEVTLLALLLTLTPGSFVLEVSPDKKVLYAHTMVIPELSNAVQRSKIKFEEAIKKVTR